MEKTGEKRKGHGPKPPKPLPLADEAERIKDMLKEAGQAVMVALDAFQEHPRWCGLPGPDAGKGGRDGCQYPQLMYHSQYMLDCWPDPSFLSNDRYQTFKRPTDEESGHRWHLASIRCLATMLEGAFGIEISGKLKPKSWIDLIRATLRYEERLDKETLMTKAFGLLRCVTDGPAQEDQWSPVPADGALPTYRRYKYAPLADTSDVAPVLMRAIEDASQSMKAAFDACAVALLSVLKPTERDIAFLKLARDAGGEITRKTVVEWLDKRYKVTCAGPSDPAVAHLRKFCDKLGGSYSRSPWKLRPEAIELLARLEKERR